MKPRECSKCTDGKLAASSGLDLLNEAAAQGLAHLLLSRRGFLSGSAGKGRRRPRSSGTTSRNARAATVRRELHRMSELVGMPHREALRCRRSARPLPRSWRCVAMSNFGRPMPRRHWLTTGQVSKATLAMPVGELDASTCAAARNLSTRK